MAKKTTHNPVAKHAHRFNRCARHKDATQYRRNDKHKARQSDSSGPFFALAFLIRAFCGCCRGLLPVVA